MIDKTKNILSIILAIFIIFAIGYSLVTLLINAFEEPDIITADEVHLYTIESNIVTNYSVYYYLEDCLDNLVEATRQNKYDELYRLYIGEYKEEMTKDDVYAKLAKFSINDTQYKLKKVYTAESLYILEYDLNGSTNYMFITLGELKDASYQFALI